MVERTRGLHEAVRVALEERMNGAWRITKIREDSITKYDATLMSMREERPEYILSEVTALFEFAAIENGPLEELIDGESTPVIKRGIAGRAQLLIMTCGLLIPRGSR